MPGTTEFKVLDKARRANLETTSVYSLMGQKLPIQIIGTMTNLAYSVATQFLMRNAGQISKRLNRDVITAGDISPSLPHISTKILGKTGPVSIGDPGYDRIGCLFLERRN